MGPIAEDDPLYAEMLLLQQHIQALTVTNVSLHARLAEAQTGAEEVTRKLTHGKREAGGDAIAIAASSPSPDAYRRKKRLPMASSLSTSSLGSSAATEDTEVGEEASCPPTYRSCGAPPLTTGESAASIAASDQLEFDAHQQYDEDEAPDPTYRSCGVHVVDDFAYDARDVESLRQVVAALGALAAPGASGATSAAVEEQLDQLAVAMRAFVL